MSYSLMENIRRLEYILKKIIQVFKIKISRNLSYLFQFSKFINQYFKSHFGVWSKYF